ncbi:MAG: triose-phosphate isomerase [Rhodospirillaceae bacterium]|nr:triose-phosphate isomerase [Rhodospirillaceae bacterium]MBT5194275.1 triose-phosphate isomerase [Rhodospirillaceae bacterium]MBT5897600.1 triose-phosphate isomerase [Rhodospirillaceae bacterium]MBT6426495.1 triose-phosphate isomerase [Rhodospirillaceae bacterium]MBT7761038.1 triose-phosphate isomerase [Rhodospirillaceae bacterium]
MAAKIRPLIAGNWKMNGLKSAGLREARNLARTMKKHGKPGCDVLVCPPATLLAPLRDAMKGSHIAIGGQDCHGNEGGAHTGDISASMLKDTGCAYVIVGHSERRADHGESSREVRAKAEAAHRAGLRAIICVGETAAERKRGQTLKVIGKQLADSLPKGSTAKNTVVAYEPVWAIGTGLTPTVEDVAEVHASIRSRLRRRFRDDGAAMQLLYGGSVKGSNAAELMAVANVNGALVGGASLTAADFWPIVETCI